MRLFKVALGLGLGLLGVVLCSPRKQHGSLPSVLVGDSMAVGLVGPLRTLGAPLHPVALEGTKIEYWATGAGRQLLNTELAKLPPNGAVMVALGTNDAYEGDGYAETAAGAAQGLLQALASVGMVYWIAPPKLPASYGGRAPSATVLERIKAVVQAAPNAVWIDESAANIERSADQLHPTGAGYQYWADLIFDNLAQTFVSPQVDTSAAAAVQGEPKPAVIPPKPKPITYPSKWRLLHPSEITREVSTFATSILFQAHPWGDIQEVALDGKTYGALTDLHFDDHVDGHWKWHKGITMLTLK